MRCPAFQKGISVPFAGLPIRYTSAVWHDVEYPWFVSNGVSVHWLDRAASAAEISINVYRVPGAIYSGALVLDE